MYSTDSIPAQELPARLDACMRNGGLPQAKLTALAGRLAPAIMFPAIADDPSWLARVAARSHRHDNGFDKIVLSAPLRSPQKLVLHVWWVTNKCGDTDNIHNHRWDFASVVLCGQVRTEFYDSDPEGESYPVLRYTSPGSGGSYTTTADGVRRVAVQATMTLAAGSEYVWRKELLHRAWGVGAPLTATLVVQGRPECATTTVLTRSEPSADVMSQSRPLHRLEPSDVARTLRAVAVHLAP
jgi:hypothetical protein